MTIGIIEPEGERTKLKVVVHRKPRIVNNTIGPKINFFILSPYFFETTNQADFWLFIAEWNLSHVQKYTSKRKA